MSKLATAEINGETFFKGFQLYSELFPESRRLISGEIEERIIIGLYQEDEATAGEFCVEWSDNCIELRAFQDAWSVFPKMPELFSLLDESGSESITPQQFANKLSALGYKQL